jgi:hypothetical protein
MDTRVLDATLYALRRTPIIPASPDSGVGQRAQF